MKQEYNVAFLKSGVAIIFTLLLNNLCSRGLDIISWIIVFIPFVLMTLVISVLLFVFGLNPVTGQVMVQDLTKPARPEHVDARIAAARQNNIGHKSTQKSTLVSETAASYTSTQQTPLQTSETVESQPKQTPTDKKES